MKSVNEMIDYYYNQRSKLGLGHSTEIKKIYMSKDLINVCKSQTNQIFNSFELKFAGVPVIEVVGENYFEVGI